MRPLKEITHRGVDKRGTIQDETKTKRVLRKILKLTNSKKLCLSDLALLKLWT